MTKKFGKHKSGQDLEKKTIIKNCSNLTKKIMHKIPTDLMHNEWSLTT